MSAALSPLRSPATWLKIALVALLYFATGRLGLALPYVGTFIALIWMPTGVAVAALWRWGPAMALGVFAGATAVNLGAGAGAAAALAIAAGNTAAPWLAVHLLRRADFRDSFARPRDVLSFALLAAPVSMALSATNGVLVLWLAGAVAGMQAPAAWLSWWVGDAVGVLVAGVPLLTSRTGILRATFSGRRGLQSAALLAALGATGVLLFATPAPIPTSALFIPFVLLSWLALRAGVWAASAGALLLALFAAFGTARGIGPFAGAAMHLGLLDLWGYMAALIVVTLLICAFAAERETTARRLSALYEHALDGILLTRPDGSVIAANPAARALLGMDEAQIRARGRAGLIDATDARLAGLLHERVRNGRAQGVLRFIRADGSTVECEVGSSIYADAGGQTLAHVVLRDLSPLRRATERLARSEQRLQLALAAAGLGLWEFDLRSGAGLMNERWLHLLGYGPGEAPNTMEAFRALLHPGDWERVERVLREQRAGGGETLEVEIRMRHKDGSWRWFLEQGKVVERGPDGAAWRAIGTHMDITARKQAEARVLASEQHFRLMANAAPVLIWTADAQQRRNFFNDYWLEFTGHAAADAVAGAWAQAVHPNDRARLDELVARAFAAQQPYLAEYRLRRADGEYRTMLERGLPRQAGGAFDGFIGSCVDVTELKQVQRELAASEARFAAFMDHSPALAWITDAAGRVLYVNRAYERVVGTTGAPLVARTVDASSAPGAPALDAGERANAAHVLAERRPQETVEGGRRADGSPGQFLMVRFPLPAADGGWLVGGMGLDVTERARAEDALRASEARLRMVLEGGEIAVWEWDPATDAADWDERLSRLLGLEPGTPKSGALFIERIHPDDRARVQESFGRAVAERTEFSEEFRVLRRDGVGWLAGRGRAVYGDDGRARRVVGATFDITARRESQQALIIAETAERANRAKTEFLSRMSHELRTPLNAVLGFAQLMQLDRALGGENQERVRQIITAGRHLLAMINDVLDLSRIESGRMSLSLEPVDVRQTVRDALALVGTLAAHAGITLTDASFGAHAVHARADRVRLQQVLSNLLTNAIKYNRPGGQVTLKAAADAAEVRLAVIDTGRGLSAEQRAHLFEPFNRLGAESGAIEGTGIGLTVCRGLVELMDGRIEVQSEPGQGSTFTVVLPRAQAAPATAPVAVQGEPAPAAPSGARPRTVLYAEDNELNVQVVRHAFALDPSLRLLVARNGAHALALARRERPDLLLVDMHLGDMFGLDLRAQLQADPATQGIPCIALSADAMPEQIRRAREAGFVDYLTKPFDVRDLLARIDAALAPGAR